MPIAVSPAMIVEFVGHPGAGKSTLHRLLAAELEELGVPVRVLNAAEPMGQSRLWRRVLQAYGLVRSRRITRTGFKFLTSSKNVSLRTIGHLGGTAHRAIRIEMHDTDTAVILVDEGVFHAAWSLSLFASQMNYDALGEFLSRTARASGLVSVRPSLDATVRNLRTKYEHPLRSHSASELFEILQRQEPVLDFFEAQMGLNGWVARLDDAADGTVAKIARQMADRWESSIPT